MRKFLLSLGFLFVLAACQNAKTEFGLPENDDPRVPNVEISVENPPEAIIYFAPHYSRATPGHAFFTAKGLGGLGGTTEGVNTLVPYNGIKVNVTEGISEKNIQVSLTGSGDRSCENLFVFDPKSSTIKMNDSAQIDTLTECTLNVKVSAISENGRVAKYEHAFSFVLNPTLAEYARQDDPLVKALMKQSGFSNAANLISWLEVSHNSSSIKVNFDAKLSAQIQNANALTGLIHLAVLDVSSTGFESTRALSYLTQLTELNLSKTKITPTELSKIATKTNVSILVLESASNIDNLSFLDANFKNLDELNISNNSTLLAHLSFSDAAKLGELKQLRVLKMANTGLVNFSQFSRLANFENSLVVLNVAHNDLSTLDNSDSSFLKSLKKLETLDVSHTVISTFALNNYFSMIEKSRDSKLKTFIYRGPYVSRESADSGSKFSCNDKTAAFTKNISNLILPSSLETIDFHGQGCIDDTRIAQGLVDTNIFSRVTNLVKLDISSTPVKDFRGLKDLQNLKEVVVADEDGPIAMTRAGCTQSKLNLISHVENVNCSMLPEAGKLSVNFDARATAQTFVVPNNVWSVTVRGCSGANGGAGGGAGGSLGTMLMHVPAGGSTIRYFGTIHAVDGGNSGSVNAEQNSFTEGNKTPIRTTPVIAELESFWKVEGAENVFPYSAYANQNGAQGALGTQSKVFGLDGTPVVTFASASANIAEQSEKCVGGVNGAGGASIMASNIFLDRTKKTPASVVHGFSSGSGAKNNFAPWSSAVEVYTIPVQPGQILNVSVGFGGQGGRGGMPQYITTPKGYVLDGRELPDQRSGDGKENKDYLGKNGSNGTAGANGFVTIEWDAA